MGQILIIEGADFSANPNAVNAIDLPVISGGLYGFYNGRNVEVDGSDAILKMASSFTDGPEFSRLAGESTSPTLHPTGTTYFKGGTVVYGSTPGLVAPSVYDLTEGVSFTFMVRLSVSSDTASNRCLLGLEDNYIQLYSATSLSGHLRIGAPGSDTVYDIGMGGIGAGTHAITFVLTKTAGKLYVDGVGIPSVDISGSSLPDTLVGMTSIGSNWLGVSRTSVDQLRQLYIHSGTLSTPEVQAIHNALPSLLA